MRLVPKLIVFTISAIVIPMMIIVLSAGILVFENNNITQWELLEGIALRVTDAVADDQSFYLEKAKEIADQDYLRDKTYVYSKYWNQINPDTRDFDIVPVVDYLEKQILREDLESISIYRREDNRFIKFAGISSGMKIPDEFNKLVVQESWAQPVYFRSSEGIFLKVTYPVFSEGNLVGLLLLQKGYDKNYFSRYYRLYEVKTALISDGDVLFNSVPDTGAELAKMTESDNDELRIRFGSGSTAYIGYMTPFRLDNDLSGTFVLYYQSGGFFNQSGGLIKKLLVISLFCVLIPTLIFFIREIRLITMISSLEDAATRISGGDLAARVIINSKDEMGSLSRNFNRMVKILEKNGNELKNRNRELQLKNTYIDAVFHSLQINIIVLDEKNRIQVVSRSARSRLNIPSDYNEKDLLDIPCFREHKGTIADALKKVWQDCEVLNLPSITIENTGYEMLFYPLTEENERVQAMVIVMVNITERMEMEKALIRSDRLASVGQIAAGLAHEINNPMNVVLNHIQLLQEEQLSHDERERFISRVEVEVKRISRLIENLLRFSREESGNEEPVFHDEVIMEVASLFNLQRDILSSGEETEESGTHTLMKGSLIFNQQKIDISLTQKGRRRRYSCCRDSLKQVFFNLIKNAFQACEETEGKIRIEIEYAAGKTMVVIHDNGRGIQPENMEKIFDPFFTLKNKGTGLGLSLCRKILDQWGASIRMKSGSGGTSVELMFPDRGKY